MQEQSTTLPDAPPCPKCGGPRVTYVRGGKRAGQLAYGCKPCLSSKSRRWRNDNLERARLSARERYASNPGPTKARAVIWNRANRERFTAMIRARKIIAGRIKRGTLIRPDRCEQCGASGVAIEAAHSNYSRPLDVRWLCRPCHRQWDRADPKTLK